MNSFFFQAWSVLLRTVHSVINRSPPRLLEEIVLGEQEYGNLSLYPHRDRDLSFSINIIAVNVVSDEYQMVFNPNCKCIG